jgi:hypothetical protein
MVLAMACSLLVSTPATAQVLVHFPCIDDATPQWFYRVSADNSYGYDGGPFGDSTNLRYRAMRRDYSEFSYLAARDIHNGEYHLVRGSVWFTPSFLDLVGPIGHPVEGMVLHERVLYGAAFDTQQWSTVVVAIDRLTGAGTIVATLPLGLRFRGLTNDNYSGDLYCVTRDPVSDASALYRIDPTSWGVEQTRARRLP